MAKTFTKNIFASTYKDDHTDSAGFHRILFNSGRSLQARELTQMQTITQRELSRVGRHLFKEGAPVNPGGLMADNAVEYIKLDTAADAYAYPTDETGLVGTELTSSEGVVVKVRRGIAAEGSDPAALFVTYSSTSSIGGDNTIPVRVTPGTVLTGGAFTFKVQSINTTANPAVGRGTFCSVHPGDFFVKERFVFCPQQTVVVSKFTSNPTAVVGFKVVESVVTAADDDTLYDNQGSTPNRSAPGADRYKISLEFVDQATLDSADNFVYVAKIQNGVIITEVTAGNNYNVLEDRLALRTSEESGNYIVKQFKMNYVTNDLDPDKVDVVIGRGVAYVNGFRSVVDAPINITIDKPRTTRSISDEAIGISYGNYLVVSSTTNKGLFNVDTFEQVNFLDDSSYAGNTIGTARVAAVTENSGSGLRVHMFDIVMNEGQNRRDIKSFGTDSDNYANVVLEANKAVFKETGLNNFLFDLPITRPQSVTGIDLTTQRRILTSAGTGGAISLTGLSADPDAGETWINTNDWLIATPTGALITGWSATGAGTQSATITNTGLTSGNVVEVLAYVRKQNAAVRSKTLETVTATFTPDANGNISLNKADIYDIEQILTTDANGDSIATRYRLDNGQRDTYYGLGRLVLKTGQSKYTGTVYVKFRYFSHGTTGYCFGVNSYDGQIAYGDIPNYTKQDGAQVNLANVLDFRSVVNTSGTFGSGAIIHQLPQSSDVVEFNVSYYLGKAIKVVIDENHNVSVIESDPDLVPKLPTSPSRTMDLFHSFISPYMVNDNDANTTLIKAKRFTMKDIAKLEDRIDTLEEVTALSLLEVHTDNLAVFDANGLNRAKSGFFVDNFADHARAFTEAEDYRAAIDPQAKVMRPSYLSDNIPLAFDSDYSSNVVVKGDNVYLQYTQTRFIDQPLATEALNVNPFAVTTKLALVELSPTSDEWREWRYAPERVIDGGVRLVINTPFNWNEWLWNWGGTEADAAARAAAVGQGGTLGTVSVGNNDWTARVVKDETVREFVSDRIIDTAFIPWMRSRKIYFKVQGLPPYRRMFAFFDNVPVSNWVRQETDYVLWSDRTRQSKTFRNSIAGVAHWQQNATSDSYLSQHVAQIYGNTYSKLTEHPDGKSELVSDGEGTLIGSFFLPSTETARFRAGEREFKVLDISLPDENSALAIGKQLYTSQGILETRQQSFLSTRVMTIGGTNQQVRGLGGGKDPLAQTFTVEEPEGIFVTRIGVKFATKSATKPVALQLRPTVNGVPASNVIIPGGTKVLSPSSVLLPAVELPTMDQLVTTWFEFDEPVYLQGSGTEYSFIVGADSVDYTMYVAKTEEFVLNSTERRVAKQPHMGSLFLSQNTTTWEPDQTRDMCFLVDRAVFNFEQPGVLALRNIDLSPEMLPNNPLSTTAGTNDVYVPLPGHGFTVSDQTVLDGATAMAGIKASSINGLRTISYVDGFGFVVDADSDATESVVGGGNSVTVQRQFQFDIGVPSITSITPEKTQISYTGRFVSGKSLANDGQVAYLISQEFLPLEIGKNNDFPTPRLIASTINEIDNLERKPSILIKATMVAQSDFVSPVVDLQRASFTAIANYIDYQDSDETANNRNTPYQWISETSPEGGTSLAKHITMPVQLEQDAVGLKVMMAVNRPAAAAFDLYYRTSASDDSAGGTLLSSTWVKEEPIQAMPSDENPEVFREYEYLIGGDDGSLTAFDQFQFKIVMNTTNSTKVPVFRDMRVIALSI
jgi:hypothetical protein